MDRKCKSNCMRVFVCVLLPFLQMKQISIFYVGYNKINYNANIYLYFYFFLNSNRYNIQSGDPFLFAVIFASVYGKWEKYKSF